MVVNNPELKKKLQVRRLTKQREVLFHLFEDQVGKHLHADDLYQLAKKKLPKINLSTVYRTLKEFKQAKLVDEIHLGEEHHHYELRGHGHQHLICVTCMGITECKTALIEKLKDEVHKKYGFSLEEIKLDITGVCKQCLKKL